MLPLQLQFLHEIRVRIWPQSLNIQLTMVHVSISSLDWLLLISLFTLCVCQLEARTNEEIQSVCM